MGTLKRILRVNFPHKKFFYIFKKCLHVSCVVDSKESKVLNFLVLTDALSVGGELGVVGLVECLFSVPFEVVSPSLTSSPVADKVFITRINKDIDLFFFIFNYTFKIGFYIYDFFIFFFYCFFNKYFCYFLNSDQLSLSLKKNLNQDNNSKMVIKLK